MIYTPLVYYHYLLKLKWPKNKNIYVVRLCSFFLAFLIQENSNHLLNQEDIELMPIQSASQEKSNAAAILISTENIDDDDNAEDDFLDHENMKLMPMPSTSQENSNAAAILISLKNIDDADDDADEEEENSNNLLHQESMELLPMPSTSQGHSNAAATFISTEKIDDDDDEEADSFSNQKLFSFAWQIAKGMVGINIANSK